MGVLKVRGALDCIHDGASSNGIEMEMMVMVMVMVMVMGVVGLVA